MRKAKFLATALLAAALIPLGPATAAHADNGNNNASCDTGEICFRYGTAFGWDVNACFSRTFYWSNHNHANEYWAFTLYPCGDSVGTTFPIRNTIGSVWNRDTQCTVKLWQRNGDGSWAPRGAYVRGGWGTGPRANGLGNDAHTRCNEAP
jgi:hypothetical protein